MTACAGFILGACTVPPQLMGTLFEPTPPPKPVVRQPRRQPYKPPPIAKAPTEPVQAKTNWAQVLAGLPRDAGGNVDWADAVEEGLIELKTGIDPKAEEQPQIDLDIELIPKEAPDFKVVYPHKIHTKMLGCTNCHTAIFQMEKGADPITMEKIFAGEYCGRCHGKVAFEPATGCPRCHKGMPQ